MTPYTRLTFGILTAGLLIALALAVPAEAASPANSQARQVPLRDGWTVQSAAKAPASGEQISTTSFTPSGEIRGTDCDEGYETIRAPSGELVLAARSQHGLANGLYDARRALLVECHKRDLAPAQLPPPGVRQSWAIAYPSHRRPRPLSQRARRGIRSFLASGHAMADNTAP